LVEFEKALLKVSHFNFNLFSASGPAQNATWVKSKGDFSCVCKAMWTQFLPLDQFKMRFGWSRKNDDSSFECYFEKNFYFL